MSYHEDAGLPTVRSDFSWVARSLQLASS